MFALHGDGYQGWLDQPPLQAGSGKRLHGGDQGVPPVLLGLVVGQRGVLAELGRVFAVGFASGKVALPVFIQQAKHLRCDFGWQRPVGSMALHLMLHVLIAKRAVRKDEGLPDQIQRGVVPVLGFARRRVKRSKAGGLSAG